MTLSAPPPDSDDITSVTLTELKWITQGTYKDFVTTKPLWTESPEVQNRGLKVLYSNLKLSALLTTKNFISCMAKARNV